MERDYKEYNKRLILVGKETNERRTFDRNKIPKFVPQDEAYIKKWASDNGYTLPTGWRLSSGHLTTASRSLSRLLKLYFVACIMASTEETHPVNIAGFVRIRRSEINPDKVKFPIRWLPNGEHVYADAFNYVPFYHVSFKLSHSFKGLNKYFRRLSSINTEKRIKARYVKQMFEAHPEGNYYNVTQ